MAERANPDPAPAPAATTAVNCTCPVCKSVVTFSDGALTGGEPSAGYLALEQSRDAVHVLDGELAAAKAKLAELEETAAGHDDPPAETHYFL
jgi:hypothetical protein